MRVGIAQTQPGFIHVLRRVEGGFAACALGAIGVGMYGSPAAAITRAIQDDLYADYPALTMRRVSGGNLCNEITERNDCAAAYGYDTTDPRPAIADWLDTEATRLDGGAS